LGDMQGRGEQENLRNNLVVQIFMSNSKLVLANLNYLRFSFSWAEELDFLQKDLLIYL
jgi:hypothetical protein